VAEKEKAAAAALKMAASVDKRELEVRQLHGGPLASCRAGCS
jgi:hypothetical protein